jgi:hypothetical protein
MQWYLVIVICAIAVGLSAGCNRKDAAKSTPVSTPAAKPQAMPTKVVVETKKASPKVDGKAAPASKPQPKAEQTAAVSPPKKEEKKVVVNKSERIAILSPGGPIAVDLLLTIDGRPHAEVFEEVLDQVLAAADTDKDGRSTWKELAGNTAYLAKERGGMSYEGPGQL